MCVVYRIKNNRRYYFLYIFILSFSLERTVHKQGFVDGEISLIFNNYVNIIMFLFENDICCWVLLSEVYQVVIKLHVIKFK